MTSHLPNILRDNTVANYNSPEPGDGIVIWDGKFLLGAGVIATIRQGETTKTRLRCPKCRKTNIKERRQTIPRYRCHRQDCRNTFDEPVEELLNVTTFQTDHEAGWIDLSGLLDASELRGLCFQAKSQQSLRPLNWRKFLDAIGGVERQNLDKASARTDAYIAGGHKLAITRVRTGQAAFRKQLLKTYGSQCAFTGPAPEHSLDAAHLYSYALIGRHHDEGGLLLRKDLHRLFDLGLIAINPSSLRLHLASQVFSYEQYASLQDAKLTVKLTKSQKKWVQSHWANHRN